MTTSEGLRDWTNNYSCLQSSASLYLVSKFGFLCAFFYSTIKILRNIICVKRGFPVHGTNKIFRKNMRHAKMGNNLPNIGIPWAKIQMFLWQSQLRHDWWQFFSAGAYQPWPDQSNAGGTSAFGRVKCWDPNCSGIQILPSVLGCLRRISDSHLRSKDFWFTSMREGQTHHRAQFAGRFGDLINRNAGWQV